MAQAQTERSSKAKRFTTKRNPKVWRLKSGHLSNSEAFREKTSNPSARSYSAEELICVGRSRELARSQTLGWLSWAKADRSSLFSRMSGGAPGGTGRGDSLNRP